MVLDGMCVWDIVLSWDVRNCGWEDMLKYSDASWKRLF